MLVWTWDLSALVGAPTLLAKAAGSASPKGRENGLWRSPQLPPRGTLRAPLAMSLRPLEFSPHQVEAMLISATVKLKQRDLMSYQPTKGQAFSCLCPK